MKILNLFILFFIFTAVVASAQSTGTFTDTRDNQVYHWIKAGSQTWMTENLQYYYRDADGYYYNYDSVENHKYGIFYRWKNAAKVCPKGWKLPAEKDWKTLILYLGANNAGTIIQAWDTVGKTASGASSAKQQGFSTLLSGMQYPNGTFLNVTYYGGCWTSTLLNDSTAVNILFARKTAEAAFSSNNIMAGFNVRCIKK